MRQLLAVVLAGSFALMVAAPVVAAEPSKEDIAKACKGKKAGEEVTIGGKKVKCPATKK